MKMSRDFIPFEEVLDATFGAPGTPERDEYDMGIRLWLVGQKIREIRQARKLTQEDLGKLIGVQKAQVSKIENGKNLTIATLLKVFKALGVDARVRIEGDGLSLAMN
jgi:DNA-binding XRE family transcriptional regulator